MGEQGVEFTGKNVDEAIAEGLRALGLTADQAEIEVLSKGSRGIFGIGSEPARVRIVARPTSSPAPSPAEPATPPQTAAQPEPTPTPSPAEPAVAEPAASQEQPVATQEAEPEAAPSGVEDPELERMAVEMLERLVTLMGFEARVVASWRPADDGQGPPSLYLDIQGQDLGALIGRRGETLASIQYLLRLMVNQRLKEWKAITVDVEQYKERRITQLTQLALRMAEQVADTGRSIALEPMPPNERRIVHLALRDHPAVFTQSSGEGERRKVNIVAKRQ